MNSTGRDLYYQMHAELCQVFTSPKRLEIIDLLRDGEKSVQQLVDLTGIPQANLSQHLAVLRQQKIVVTRRDGTCIYYSIPDLRIAQALDLVRDMLLERLKADGRAAKKIEAGLGR
ncbi:MAG: helix-turn-helix transcriptional regulator [Acidobacteria bacterium]|nr:helix-turn-helix transcriptional regulator [Acidobacteriota bacterium]